MNGCRKIANVNLLNLNDIIHILHTVLHTYPVLLIRMICLTIEIFFTCYWVFLLTLSLPE